MTERHRILLDLIRRQEQFKLRVRRPLDPKVMKYIEEGKPFAVITDDGVLCLLCGKHLQQAASHFSRRHGLPLSPGVPRHERLILYGLKQGDRLASLEFRQDCRNLQVAKIRADLVPLFTSSERPSGRPRGKVPFPPTSDRQRAAHLKNIIAAFRESARLRHARAIINAICPNCAQNFSFVRSRGRKYCSLRCATTSNGRKRWAVLDADQRKIVVERLLAGQYRWHSKDRAWLSDE